jgi:predicted ferric reductase
MRKLTIAFWSGMVLLSALWLAVDPNGLLSTNVFTVRAALVEYTGVLAIGCMSVAMILASRPRWPERWFGGLDKMYRMHKWLGIGGLALGIAHWFSDEVPKWVVMAGWLERPARAPRAPVTDTLGQIYATLHHAAGGLGEWAFYVAAVAIVLALLSRVTYGVFAKAHRVLPFCYLLLVFHSALLIRPDQWLTPFGMVVAVLMAYGSLAAVQLMFRRSGAHRKVQGTLVSTHYSSVLRTLSKEIVVPNGWSGHRAGQFAFVTTDPSEGAHPYTIASAWNPADPKITFVVKELGDHTSRLRHDLRIGQEVTLEGPYGCFTFDDDRPHQIWVGGGIGITPFIARMKEMALRKTANAFPMVDLFHTTADYDEEVIAGLKADAEAAGIRLHVVHDRRDGRLSGERIRAMVPGWKNASIWFCGPTRFGQVLKEDFGRMGLAVSRHYHQELFAMR